MKLKSISPRIISQQQAGGVMVAALLITAAATFGFAAWATLISQRRQGIEQTVGGLQRRLAVESGRQIARHLAYTKVLTKNSGAAVNVSITPQNGAQIQGGVSSLAWTGYAMDSVSFPTGANHFSPSASRSAYGVAMQMEVPFSVTDYQPELSVVDTGTTRLVTTLQSRSPLLSGDILTVYNPTLATDALAVPAAITGNLDVAGGRAVFYPIGALSNYSTVRATAVSTPNYVVPNTNALQTRDPDTNQIILPSNFPSPLVTTGSVETGNGLDAQNRLNVIDSPNNPSNSFKEKIRTGSSMTISSNTDVNQSGVTFSTATGLLTIDLNQISLPGVIIDNNVSEIHITGKTSPDVPNFPYSSVAICYVEDAAISTKSLSKIKCTNADNTRRLIIGVKKIPATGQVQLPGSPVTVEFTDSNTAPVWRMMLVSENAPLVFSAAGGPGVITLRGGIMTDASITATSGVGNSVRLIPELDPQRLDRLAPRRAWVETYLDFENGSL